MVNRITLLIGLVFWGCTTKVNRTWDDFSKSWIEERTVQYPIVEAPFQPQRASDCGELHYRLNKIELEYIASLDKIPQGGNSYRPAMRFFPKFMFGDETTKIVQNGPTNKLFKVYDDGTHGDDISGDGLYSRSCISMNDLQLNYNPLLFDGMVAVYPYNYPDEAEELFIINPKLRGKIKFEDYGDGLQGTSNALFVAIGDRYEFIYKDPEDQFFTEYYEHGPLHNPTTSISAIRVLSQFGDVFDHLVFVPDVPFWGKGYFRVRDDIQGIMTYGDPICHTGVWMNKWTDKKWVWPWDHKERYDEVIFGCPKTFLGHPNIAHDYPRLKGNIWFGESRSVSGLNHEFGHWMGIGPRIHGDRGIKTWPARDFDYLAWNWPPNERHISASTTVSNVMTGPLVVRRAGGSFKTVRVKDKDGIWKEVQIEKNDDGTFTEGRDEYNRQVWVGDGTFTMVPINPMKHERYDDILLYMMGFKSPEEANKRYYLFGAGVGDESDIKLNDCFYQNDSKGEPSYFSTGPSGLYCYDNIIDQSEYGTIVEFGVQEMIDQFGPRVPSYEDAPKHLDVGVIVLTRDIASEATRAWYHLLYGWWANENDWDAVLGGATWPFATRGLATIKTGIPK